MNISWKRSQILAAITIWIVAVLNALGTHYNLYWRLEWFDIVQHVLGGFVIGAVVLWLHDRYSSRQQSFWGLFGLVILWALIIGFAWELFEYFMNIENVFSVEKRLDTILDLIMDTAGSILALFAGILVTKRIHE